MEEQTGIRSSITKRFVVGLGILVLLAGATTGVYYWINRGNPMSTSSQTIVTVGVPALDAETPEQVETATFAMG